MLHTKIKNLSLIRLICFVAIAGCACFVTYCLAFANTNSSDAEPILVSNSGIDYASTDENGDTITDTDVVSQNSGRTDYASEDESGDVALEPDTSIQDLHVEFPVISDGANGNKIEYAPNNLITNTTKLVVSSDEIGKGDEVVVYLYSSDSMQDPIMSTTLTSESGEAIFENLTSAMIYRVGIALKSNHDLNITVSDK